MNDERLEILMNQELDGANTPAESRELQDALASDSGARRQFDELREATEIFTKAEILDPPHGLRERILAAAAQVAPPAAEGARPGWRKTLGDIFRPLLRPIPAGSFAVGVATGLLIFAAFGLRPGDHAGSPEILRGMAGQDWDTRTEAPELMRSLDNGPLAGRLVLRPEGAGMVLRIELESVPGYQVRVTSGPGLACTGFSGPGAGTAGLRVSGDAVSFGVDGSGDYAIHYARTGKTLSNIKIQFHNEGKLVAEHNLATGSGLPWEKN